MSHKFGGMLGMLLGLVCCLALVAAVYAITVDGNVSDGQWTTATCFDDIGGANDPTGDGQKDITRTCAQDPDYPTSIDVYWNWDEQGISGGNSLDACALFDTDGDGKANYAVCVKAGGNPATYTERRVFNCPTDDASDSCGGYTQQASPGTTCAVAQNNNDPFTAGDNYPTDTTAECSIPVGDIGGASSRLIDVCSYPSASIPSSPSDCLGFSDIPLAVTLQRLSARGQTATIPTMVGVLAACGLTGLGLAALKRRKT